MSETFEYSGDMTRVIDAAGGTTTYKIFNKQIYKITDPLGAEISQTWFIDKNSWFDPITEQIQTADDVKGAAKALKSMTDRRGLITSYHYDDSGNRIATILEGIDLTGTGETCIAKTFIYNNRHQCIEESVVGHRTRIHYDEIFSYLPKRIETYVDDQLISFTELSYNTQGELIKENHTGAITLWEYNAKGFPTKRVQQTGTQDPDLVTEYVYSPQGKCIKEICPDSIQETAYDIMGSAISSKLLSLSGNLISATYTNYNLNQDPIRVYSSNPDDVNQIYYNTDGRIKALSKALEEGKTAYTLYDYDARGYLIEETDPRGYCTSREYSALGQVISQTKEGLTTRFSYEPGGLIKSAISPSGATIISDYITNGLLIKEHYPDGTEYSKTYDIFGRVVSETRNGITCLVHYDDVNRKVIYTQPATNTQEIHEFDSRGNLTRRTDSAGYSSTKAYDHLNRLIEEIAPTGEQTYWSYQENGVICSLPSGETVTTLYEGGQCVASSTFNAHGALIASTQYAHDPIENKETITQGDFVTTTWRNTLGLPVKVQQGNLITTYQYDACGNCIASKDGLGQVIYQQFDGLSRLTQKQLPDHTLLRYVYDSDSNLIEYHLPNENVWHASYDSMNRKILEYVQAKLLVSNLWNYVYEAGRLKEIVDPANRHYFYSYNNIGQLVEESVENSRRQYIYDSRGLLIETQQIHDQDHSLVQRSYDPSGRLIVESIFLNGNCLQNTLQSWTPSSRTLQIDSHTRTFTYENQHLTHLDTSDLSLSYAYNLGGALTKKQVGTITTQIDYLGSRLPKTYITTLPETMNKETLSWTLSGRLVGIETSASSQQFDYNSRGYLTSANDKKYEFDFGKAMTGVCTSADSSYIPNHGLDAFGKVVTSVEDGLTLSNIYDAMGQRISHGETTYEWDPWGRLTKITTPTSAWEASYDSFGRRLQTHYTEKDQTLSTTSFYDPAKEFQEIGVKCNDKTFWKLYGAAGCDALIDETGTSATLVYNSLEQLTHIFSAGKTYQSRAPPSLYGPQDLPPPPTDLLSYAQSLNWHSSAQDPTGLIWLGKRYYNPREGRFLSPDPVSYPLCLDLYAYANGDPVNYVDPDGRFASAVYHTERALKGEYMANISQMSLLGFMKNSLLDPLMLNFHRQACNLVAADYADRGLTNSGYCEVGSSDMEVGYIQVMNGINTGFFDGIKNTMQVSKYAKGAKVELIVTIQMPPSLNGAPAPFRPGGI